MTQPGTALILRPWKCNNLPSAAEEDTNHITVVKSKQASAGKQHYETFIVFLEGFNAGVKQTLLITDLSLALDKTRQ